MKKNFSILMLIVSINQILCRKLIIGKYSVELGDDELQTIQDVTTKFGHSITLSDIKKCSGESTLTGKTIKQCYDDNINIYKDKIESFKVKITDVGNKLNIALGASYGQEVNVAQQELNNIKSLLEEYPDYLSKTINNFALAKNKMANKAFEFRKYLEGIYGALAGIQKSGGNKASESRSNFQNIVNEMQDDCAEIVKKIKTCMGEVN